MAVTMTLVGQTRVVVRGIDGTIATRAQWQARLDKIGYDFQGRVANSFAMQRVAGSRALLPNKPSYNAYKARNGFDTRRGHKTNQLQNALYSGRFSWCRITGPTAIIQMSEARLHAAVPHAEYYEEAKVRGGEILALAASWVREAEAKLQAWELTLRKSLAKTAGVNRAALSGAARRRIGGLIGRAVQGFREPVAPTPIKSDFKFVNSLAKEAAKLLKQSK